MSEQDLDETVKLTLVWPATEHRPRSLFSPYSRTQGRFDRRRTLEYVEDQNVPRTKKTAKRGPRRREDPKNPGSLFLRGLSQSPLAAVASPRRLTPMSSPAARNSRDQARCARNALVLGLAWIFRVFAPPRASFRRLLRPRDVLILDVLEEYACGQNAPASSNTAKIGSSVCILLRAIPKSVPPFHRGLVRTYSDARHEYPKNPG